MSAETYRFYGFPLALQLWVYECIPLLAIICAKSNKDFVMPRRLKWTVSNLVSFKEIDQLMVGNEEVLKFIII